MSIRLTSILLSLLLLTATAQAEPPIDCKTNQRGPFADLCLHETSLQRMITIDLKIKEDHGRQDTVIVDIPYANIRRSGVIVQLYYNSVLGKAQWVSLSDIVGIYLHPNSISLPVQSWIKRGLSPGQLVRIVLLFGE